MMILGEGYETWHDGLMRGPSRNAGVPLLKLDGLRWTRAGVTKGSPVQQDSNIHVVHLPLDSRLSGRVHQKRKKRSKSEHEYEQETGHKRGITTSACSSSLPREDKIRQRWDVADKIRVHHTRSDQALPPVDLTSLLTCAWGLPMRFYLVSQGSLQAVEGTAIRLAL